jgi:hypothetical protein
MLTDVPSKLQGWVWHSPKLQTGASIVMPNKLNSWIGTVSAAEVGKIQYSSFSFNVYIQREAVTASSCSQALQCHALSLRIASPSCVATVYNKLTESGSGVSPSEHAAYLAPALCIFGLLSVVFSASPTASN